MLKLDDRLRIALGAGMGVQLTSGDVETVARWLVTLQRIAEGKRETVPPHRLAQGALGEFAPVK